MYIHKYVLNMSVCAGRNEGDDHGIYKLIYTPEVVKISFKIKLVSKLRNQFSFLFPCILFENQIKSSEETKCCKRTVSY